MRGLVVMEAAMLVAGCSVGAAPISTPSIKRTDILRQDAGDAAHEVVQVRVDFAPGAHFGMHVHPGVEIAYVLEGSLAYNIEGRPPVVLEAGDALFIPAGTWHAARNAGDELSSELATYFVEKGKPLLVPARNRDMGSHGPSAPEAKE